MLDKTTPTYPTREVRVTRASETPMRAADWRSLAGLGGGIAEAMYAVAHHLRSRPGSWLTGQTLERRLPAYDRVGSALWRMADAGVLERRDGAGDDSYRWVRGSTLPCPACEGAAHYVPEMDRYVHEGGSDNRSCWLAVTRGGTAL